jgi:PUA-domain protein
MGKIKNLHRLKQKEIRLFQKEIDEQLHTHISLDNTIIETGKQENIEFVYIDKKPCFFRREKRLFFTIIGLLHFKPSRSYVIVDMGAVKFVTNGADIMAPGIVAADETIAVDDAVCICDENHKKPLAVGIAMKTGLEMMQLQKGKAVKMIHYVGDELWDLMKIYL